MFGLSKREIEKKFVRSELALLAWRSQEISASLDKARTDAKEAPPKTQRRTLGAQVPDGLPDHFFNEEGELDLRKVRGEEAYRYMAAIGIKLPVFAGVRR